MSAEAICPHCGNSALGDSDLTPREIEVLQLLAAGRSINSIATELFVAQSTVKNHLAHIYRRLGVSGGGASRAAIAMARERQLID